MDKLAKCPFCEGKAELQTYDYEGYYIVKCHKCHCFAGAKGACDTIDEAVKAWNTRSLTAQIEGVRKAVMESEDLDSVAFLPSGYVLSFPQICETPTELADKLAEILEKTK